MSDRSFFAELRHRKVYRTAAIYAGAAFVVWQVADIALPALGAPDWVMRLLVIAGLVGFPIALVLSWLVDLAPAGRTRMRLAIGALAGVALLSGGAAVVTKVDLGRSSVDLSDRTIAVLPFQVRGSAGIAYLKDGMVDLLSRNLAGTDVHLLDPSAVVKAAARLEKEGYTVTSAADVARGIGAGQFVLGTVNQAGATVRIHATLYALHDSIETIVTGIEEGDTTELFGIVDRLTAQLLAGRETGAASRRVVRTAATTTSSIAALKAYLEGERHFRTGTHDTAVAKFGQALELDSTFVLARFRRAMSHTLNWDVTAAMKDIDALRGRVERLNEHDRRVLEALDAHLAGRRAEAQRLYRAVIRDYPVDVEAKVLLAGFLMDYALLEGTPLTEVAEILDGVARLDPAFTCIACMRATAKLQAGDVLGSARVHHEAGLAKGDSSGAGYVFFVRAALERNPALVDSALAALRSSAESDTAYHDDVLYHYVSVVAGLGDFDLASDIIARMRADGAPAYSLGVAEYELACARGRRSEAGRHWDRYLERPKGVSVGTQAGVLMHSTVFPVQDVLADLRPRLVTWDPIASSHSAEPDSLLRLRRPYMLGLVDSRLGAATAASWADSLDAEARALEPDDSALVADMATFLRADIAWRRGDAQTAWDLLQRVSTDVAPGDLWSISTYLYDAANLRGFVAVDAGRFEDALRWLRYSEVGLMPVVDYGEWHLAMARALDGLGRGEEAAQHYTRVLEAWEDPDPERAADVADARRRLTALSIE